MTAPWASAVGICLVASVLREALADILVLPTTNFIPDDDVPIIANIFKDMPASFGASLSNGVEGFVVYANPPDACNSLQNATTTRATGDMKKIVLISRYNCTFEQKVRMAQSRHFDAVIVHNVNSSHLEPMHADNATGITIPAVFVSAETAIALRDVYKQPYYYVIINSESPFNFNTRLLIPFAVVVGVCFITMLAAMIVKFVRDRRRQRRHRLPRASLKQIPTCKFRRGDPYETCAICLDDYVDGDKLRVLPCAHAYHCKCIDPWLTNNRRFCPVCKRKVFGCNESPHQYEDSDTDTDETRPLIRSVAPGYGGTQTATPPPPPPPAASDSDSSMSSILTTSGEHSINADVERTRRMSA